MAKRSRLQVYRLELTPAAARELRKLAPDVRRRVSRKIDALAANPRPSGVEKLEAEHDLYRVRVGDYRIIYTIEDDIVLVVVVKIGNRRDVYKYLRLRP